MPDGSADPSTTVDAVPGSGPPSTRQSIDRASGHTLASSPQLRRSQSGSPPAGFAEVTFTAVHEPVYYGPDVAAALGWVRGFTRMDGVLKRLDPAGAERALERLRETLAAHAGGDGIWFDSRAWIVTARRR